MLPGLILRAIIDRGLGGLILSDIGLVLRIKAAPGLAPLNPKCLGVTGRTELAPMLGARGTTGAMREVMAAPSRSMEMLRKSGGKCLLTRNF